jgi:hypothetical protein
MSRPLPKRRARPNPAGPSRTRRTILLAAMAATAAGLLVGLAAAAPATHASFAGSEDARGICGTCV